MRWPNGHPLLKSPLLCPIRGIDEELVFRGGSSRHLSCAIERCCGSEVGGTQCADEGVAAKVDVHRWLYRTLWRYGATARSFHRLYPSIISLEALLLLQVLCLGTIGS